MLLRIAQCGERHKARCAHQSAHGGALVPAVFERQQAARAQILRRAGDQRAQVGQAIGAVLSAHGQQLARSAGQPIDGLSVAYQRILAGALFTGVWWSIMRHQQGPGASRQGTRSAGSPWPWVILNALSGPSLGVSCYQWALQSEATGIVLAITALTPLVVIPLALWFDGERPTLRSIGGGLIAVGGVVALALRR